MMNKKQQYIILIVLILIIIFATIIYSIQAKKELRREIDVIASNEGIPSDNSAEVIVLDWDSASRMDKLITVNDIAVTAGIEEDINVSLEAAEWEADYWGYNNLGIATVSNHLNIRETPSEDGKMLGKMSNNDACEILEIDGNWAHIISGKVEGYVCTDYLLTGPLAVQRAKEIVTPVATITTDSVRVREAANTECAVITLLQKGEELKVLEQQGDWYQIDLDDEIAYVYADYVDVEEKLSTGITMAELNYGNGVSDTRVQLCKYAQQFIGNPYVWGGTSLTRGVDCSGFTMQVYAHFGISLPHHSGSQAQKGRTVNLSNVKPGDLIFYTRGGTINHVAIYIGNGQVCHASSPKTGIKVSNMYYRTPYKAVSLIN